MLETTPHVIGTILKKTYWGETYVLISLIVIAAVLLVCLHRHLWSGAVRAGFWCLCGLVVVGSGVAIAVRPAAFAQLCGEGHVVEWLTAHLLLVAWVTGAVATVRLWRKGHPSPLVLFLTSGYFLAFWREMEWGEPFFGEKLVYSRHLFRPRSYFNVSRFEGIARKTGLSAELHYTATVVSMGIVVVLTVLLVVYLWRHRRLFRGELRHLPHVPWGRFFLIGAGLYVAAQMVGGLYEKLLLDPGRLPAALQGAHLPHDFISEPLELLGAMFLAWSVVAVWHGRLSWLPASRTRAAALVPKSPVVTVEASYAVLQTPGESETN